MNTPLIKRLVIATALVIAPPALTFAAQIPTSQGADSRIQQVPYKANEVVNINAHVGIATHLMLEDDETYVTHAFGDSKAWHFVMERNHVFIKPAIAKGDTNLVLITNKRTYNFKLNYSNSEVYQVKFIYPDTAKLKAQVNLSDQYLKEAWKGKTYNLTYTAKGSRRVAPVNVWDDGTFTYFKFSGNTDLPSIYAVNADDSETIVNRRVTGSSNQIIVMHKVNPVWRIRLDNDVLNIFNQSMNWQGVQNTSGTVSPLVEREVIGGDGNE